MNEVEEVLKNIGIKTKWFGLFYKSTYRVLKEISKKWDKLDDDTRNKVEHYFI